MNLMHDLHHLRDRNLRLSTKIWLFFMLFVCIVFLLMWLFQIIFLEWFYESMKIRDTAKVALHLVEYYEKDGFEDKANEIALQNEMCIELLDKDGKEVYYDCMYNGKCLLHGVNSGTFFYLIDLQNSQSGIICRRVFNESLQSEMLVYGCTIYRQDKTVAGYLLLNSPLVPVESTVSILKRQTMIITILLVFFGFLLSFFTANHIATPIINITASAKRLAHGDYQTPFEGGGYAEVDDLAETLNYTAQELSKTDEMQRDLIANVSHDLRTPLTSIYGACSAMRDNFDALPRQTHMKLLSDVCADAQWLVRMVENLLSVTRVDTSTVRLSKNDTVLEELIDAVLVKFHKHYPDIDVHVEIPEEFVSIPMDAMLISQVLMNLLENAVFHAKGMKNLWLRVEVKGFWAYFYVEDDGCGIPEEKLPKLFTGMLGSEAPMDQSRSSMGIGLSVCSAIIKAHGGEIWANKRVGGGTEVGFRLEMEDENGE